ncbi:MAG: FadR family transcriptional regulator [Betaproteobacteria bacterium]|jgi:DNA-binding FadR family transcriptional regulator|nr:FadR family transcriptional regulator [Betaproteobacteria bacterium]
MGANTSLSSPSPLRNRRGGLVPEVVDHLAQQIRSAQLAPGSKLPSESAIMDQLQVSRTVIREAISRLQAAGLVETRHGVGTFVVSPSPASNFQIVEADIATVDDVIAVLELRISLETESAGLAAQRASDDHLRQMETHLRAFASDIPTQAQVVDNDFLFHLEIAKATGNRHFVDLMNHLGLRLIPRTRINTPDQDESGRVAYLQRVHSEHESIFSAIRNRDAEAARAAMRTHLSNSRDRLRQQRQA